MTRCDYRIQICTDSNWQAFCNPMHKAWSRKAVVTWGLYGFQLERRIGEGPWLCVHTEGGFLGCDEFFMLDRARELLPPGALAEVVGSTT